jgi:hypothetical protein
MAFLVLDDFLSMKQINLLVVLGLSAMLGTLTFTAHAAGPVTRRGTSVLHYMTRNTLVTTNGSNVVGSLRLQQNEQGHSSKQSLHLFVSGLETNAPYTLIAIIGDDTNAVPVATFTANRLGRSHVFYMTRGQGGGARNPLPDELNPLTDVHAIGIENASTQTVAYAWIADADKFQYLVKRNLTPAETNGTAAGSISLIANQQHVNFRLLAGGLAVTNDYHLALNSNIVNTITADGDGRLEIKSWPTNAPAILDLRLLSLLDASSNTVLSTTLPR